MRIGPTTGSYGMVRNRPSGRFLPHLGWAPLVKHQSLPVRRMAADGYRYLGPAEWQEAGVDWEGLAKSRGIELLAARSQIALPTAPRIVDLLRAHEAASGAAMRHCARIADLEAEVAALKVRALMLADKLVSPPNLEVPWLVEAQEMPAALSHQGLAGLGEVPAKNVGRQAWTTVEFAGVTGSGASFTVKDGAITSVTTSAPYKDAAGRAAMQAPVPDSPTVSTPFPARALKAKP